MDELLLSRMCRGNSKMVELRGECPEATVAVLDAISLARSISRTDLVNAVLGEWAKQTAHEAMLVARVTRGNPAVPESTGG